MSIILSDLNGLKIINDSFGHEQGDMMLKKYANILKDSVREDALISRIGGDEFLVILPLSDVQETERLIKELSKASNGESINGVNLSVAFGYAILREKKQSMQDAIKKAEDSMYQTKLFEASSRRSKTIDLILGTLLEKNPREEKHSRRVAELCEKMAIKMGLQDDEVKRIRTAGILHDIGKIGIQEDLLNKPGSLSEDEYIELCKHPEIGYRILNTAPNMMEISDIILAHHERWDGKGYPKGLEGNETPLFSRIIAIADAYDAMTSDRSYRKALSDEVAVSEIKKNSGTQFDPDLALFFIEHVVMI
jgi:diguanylate cyclase (GGDEF)-like protein/putative nucleotidyltransferase with HDIG domain